ncbi:serine hydrolase domain-containing protein [Persicitalea jodogahamensis]|uniref:Serine-type D-Ala-D-Ala carboxypeptidase n=1 Tax=Persicitalea jodogahamensis TaxID=402147 RepID=A0A8J3G9I4_9BACT|nr:serine hydrolase domain-containing protein [Persicitalea jodogahamensis]GHB75489.1 serine-type D-Ala-D-Ala carboxypeptidase [Persicitalea jodogahamensis]
MKTKQIIHLAAFLGLALAGCQESQVAPDTTETDSPYRDHPKNDQYQAALSTFNKQWRQPGNILLLKRAGEPLWTGAVGKSDLERQRNLQISDPFRAGSITKTFVAVAIMKLQEEGKLQLENTLGELLPEMLQHIAGADRITLWQMLSHTSGIFDPVNDDAQYQLDLLNNPAKRLAMSTRDILARYVYGRKLQFEPGERFGYSNTNYWLLGMILEKKSEKRLQAVLDELVFQPADLHQTYFEPRDDRNVVRGYADFYTNGKLMDVSLLDRADSEGRASGGLITTAGDLLRFSDALFGGKIVSAASLKAMMTLPSIRQGTTEYGLGLDSYTSPLGVAWGHNGNLLGVDANWFYFPDRKATFVLFGNNGGGADKSFVNKLLEKEL